MPRASRRVLLRATGYLLGCVLALTGCAALTSGHGVVAPADLAVVGDSHGAFDTDAKNAIADVEQFWRATFPTIDGGRALPPLRGKLYSVDGDAIVATHQAPPAARGNACIRRRVGFIVDNAAYCQLDDSIVWDRGAGHLLPVLTADYGDTLTALVFAHEFGHAIQHRLGIDRRTDLRQVQIESQADCAAGAFAAWALAGKAPHVHFGAAGLDDALDGYFQVRDPTPASTVDVSHGNGFDRLNAVQQGVTHGAKYCYSSTYLADVHPTERPYESPTDYGQGGNEPLAAVLGPDNLGADLNRYWTAAGTLVHRSFRPVTLTEAAHPACGSAGSVSQFGYCADDNTVYYSSAFAHSAYYSITAVQIDPKTAQVTLSKNQPADYALGELVAIAWGLAARHQFFGASTTDAAGLDAAVCYSGAYAETINHPPAAQGGYSLSPPDMDEATFAVLKLVGRAASFGARGTTGLHRIEKFVTGYLHGLGSC